MKGLLLKDLLNLKQQSKVYLLVLAIWCALIFINKDPSFFGGWVVMLAVLIPITAMSYDEKAKWDKYALTMPVSKADMILSKYFLGFISILLGSLLSAAISVAMTGQLVESLVTTLVFISIGMIAISIILPLIFKFGVEKGRYIMLLAFLVPFGIGMVLSKLPIAAPDAGLVETLIYLSPIAALVIAAVSVLISIRIYRNKEF